MDVFEEYKGQKQEQINGQQHLSLELTNLTFSYGKKTILSQTHLSLPYLERVFLVGPSGSGKTTFINLLSGDLSPHKGSISFISSPKKDLFISTIPQNLELIEHWSAVDNLWVGYDSQQHGSKKSFEAFLRKTSVFLGLDDFLKNKICHLNRGSQQKVAILRALLSFPDLLLADEPTSALDRDNAHKVFELLEFFTYNYKMKFIWSTHNFDFLSSKKGQKLFLSNAKVTARVHH